MKARVAEMEDLVRAAGGERAVWAYEWLPTGCPAALVQLLAAAVSRPQVCNQ